MKTTPFFKRLLTALLAGLTLASAQAQSFPAKPVTLMVPYPAGGLSDVIARTINTSLAKHLGQPVMVENLGGASGAIAAQKVLNSPADGHMIFQGGPNELILAPLAVSNQMAREADKFGIEAVASREGASDGHIIVANYERLHYFNPEDFAGAVCDESSAIKAFDGVRRAFVTEFLRTIQYRLLGTATAAPNDYVELGTSSEALGYLGQRDMLTRFFTNAQNTVATNRFMGQTAAWRFKGHADQEFWRWCASWARAVRKPSDLGFSDDGFALPPLDRKSVV